MSKAKAKRATIYLPDPVAQHYQDAPNLSSRIAGVTLRYAEICRRELPKLTRDQWAALCNANKGINDQLLGDNPSSVQTMLWANVADAPGLGEKWGVDPQELVEAVRCWTYTQAVAAYEAIVRFWHHPELDTDAALIAAGVGA